MMLAPMPHFDALPLPNGPLTEWVLTPHQVQIARALVGTHAREFTMVVYVPVSRTTMEYSTF